MGWLEASPLRRTQSVYASSGVEILPPAAQIRPRSPNSPRPVQVRPKSVQIWFIPDRRRPKSIGGGRSFDWSGETGCACIVRRRHVAQFAFRKQGCANAWNAGRVLPKSGQIAIVGRIRVNFGRHGAEAGRNRSNSGQMSSWPGIDLARVRPVFLLVSDGIRHISAETEY